MATTKNSINRKKTAGAVKKSALIKVCGALRGTGFRQFVLNTAIKKSIDGVVYHGKNCACIEASAKKESIEEFCKFIRQNKLPAATIKSVTVKYLRKKFPHKGFAIAGQDELQESGRTIPDIAICPECAIEISDPKSRWYGYPFTSCSKCGPRHSITSKLPYKRENTSMSKFIMCAACAKETRDPKSRRFHSETAACAACGPALFFRGNEGGLLEGAQALAGCRSALKNGMIVAIKGTSGFHLAVDATNSGAIDELRHRLASPQKPFAMMAPGKDTIRRFCEIDDFSTSLLNSSGGPAVMLKQVKNSVIAENAAPGHSHLAVMLPFSALHRLLFDGEIDALIVTTVRSQDGAIIHTNEDAMLTLDGLADYFLMHDLDIVNPQTDSIIKPYDGVNYVFLSRGRGWPEVKKTLKASEHPEFVSVLAENRHAGSAIGVFFDDNTAGGELLTGNAKKQRFAGRLAYMAQPGGVAAETEPYRTAAAMLAEYLEAKYILKLFPGKPVAKILAESRKKNCPRTYSAGRLFDAAAAVLKEYSNNTYPGEAAMRLESLAHMHGGGAPDRPYAFDLSRAHGHREISLAPALLQMLREKPDMTREYISRAFHYTVACAILAAVKDISSTTALKTVALCGSLFKNTVLLSDTTALLKKSGFSVLISKT